MLLVGRFELHLAVVADVAVFIGVGDVASQQAERQRVAAGVLPRCVQLVVPADDPQVPQQLDRRFPRQPVELLFLGGGVSLDVGQVFAGGDDDQSGVVGGQLPQQRFERRVFQPPGLRIARRVLQRFDAVEDQQRAAPSNQPGQPLAPFMRAADGRIGVAEECECFGDEQVSGGLPALARALAVKAPVKVPLNAGPVWFFRREASLHPVEHQRRLPRPTPGHQRVDVERVVGRVAKLAGLLVAKLVKSFGLLVANLARRFGVLLTQPKVLTTFATGDAPRRVERR